MKNSLTIQTKPEVELVFNNYPDLVRSKMFALRKLVIETAKEIDGITKLEETLKWGEPSYLTKNGVTLPYFGLVCKLLSSSGSFSFTTRSSSFSNFAISSVKRFMERFKDLITSPVLQPLLVKLCNLFLRLVRSLKYLLTTP
jgi:hypothetical protein